MAGSSEAEVGIGGRAGILAGQAVPAPAAANAAPAEPMALDGNRVSALEAAVALRLEGNERFKACDLLGAVDCYTRSIGLAAGDALVWTNRALVSRCSS